MKGLKDLRLAKGLTQAQLAAIVGVDRVSITCWELGTKMPSAAKLPTIADALGCSIDDLYGEKTRKETA